MNETKSNQAGERTQKTAAAYPYTTDEAAQSINRYYERTHGVADAWAKGARGFNTEDVKPTGQCAIACTFIESDRTPGAWKEIGYGNTHKSIL